jgi:hypothetical protein
LEALGTQEKDLYFPFHESYKAPSKASYPITEGLTKTSDIPVSGTVKSFVRSHPSIPNYARDQLDKWERCDRGGFLSIGRKHNQTDYKIVDAQSNASLHDMVFTCDGFVGYVVHKETRLFLWVMVLAHDVSYNKSLVHLNNFPSSNCVMVRPYKETEVLRLPTEWVHDAMYGSGILDANNVFNLVALFHRSKTYNDLLNQLRAKQASGKRRKKDSSSDDQGSTKQQRKLKPEITKKSKDNNKNDDNDNDNDNDNDDADDVVEDDA